MIELSWPNQSLLKPPERLLRLHYKPTTKLPVLLSSQRHLNLGHNHASPFCNARGTACGQQRAMESSFPGHYPETSVSSLAQTTMEMGKAPECHSRKARLPHVDHGAKHFAQLAGPACKAKPRSSPWGKKGSSLSAGMNVQVLYTFLHLASRPAALRA